jgi:hypothetical protein
MEWRLGPVVKRDLHHHWMGSLSAMTDDTLVEKGLKSTVRYIFTDVFGYQPHVLFLVTAFKKPPLEIVFLHAVP